MNVITPIDLAAYVQVPDLTAKVMPASAMLAAVRAEFAPNRSGPRYPTMLATKARGFEFRPGEVTVWAGYNGHRKSMFTSQVALDLVAQKQRALIASLEMAPVRTMARMTRQAVATEMPVEHEVERFLGWTTDRLWLFDHVGKIDGEQCLALLRYFADKHAGQHVFIDSMMMVCASEEHLDEQKTFVTQLCRTAVETGLHVHLIAHCRKPAAGDGAPPSKYDIKGSGAISDQASNVVTVWFDREKAKRVDAQRDTEEDREKPDALVTVEKQRNGAWEGRLRYWFHAPSLRFVPERHVAVEPYRFSSRSL